MTATYLIFGGAVLFIVILLLRLLGAWMLRINEVISELEKVNKQLRELNNKS